MTNEEYAEGLNKLFVKYGIKDVYSYGNFVLRAIPNPTLYVCHVLPQGAKEEITQYLVDFSMDHKANFSVNTLTAPKPYARVYHNGKFLVKDKVEVFA